MGMTALPVALLAALPLAGLGIQAGSHRAPATTQPPHRIEQHAAARVSLTAAVEAADARTIPSPLWALALSGTARNHRPTQLSRPTQLTRPTQPSGPTHRSEQPGRSVPVLLTSAPSGSGGRFLGTFVVTCYDLGGTTASGAPAGPGSVAVDPSVIPLGTRIRVGGAGTFTADDTGGAIVGNRLDIWQPTASACDDWGVQDQPVWELS